MTLHRPLRFFAPTLAVVLAAAAGAIACGSVVDVANTNSPDASVPIDGSPDGGLSPDAQPDAATTDGGVSAASWEVRFLPWDATQALEFDVFDQVVLATPRPTAGSANPPSYLLDLAGRSDLPRVTLYDGTPFVAPGTFLAGSPRGKFFAFRTGNSTVSFTIYEFSGGKVTARAPIALPAAVADYGIVAVADDGSWAASNGTHVVFGGPGGGAAGLPIPVPNGAGVSRLLPAKQAYVLDGDDTHPGTLASSSAASVALGTAFRIVDVDDNRLLVIRNGVTADVWSISPAQKLGTLAGDYSLPSTARDTFYDAATATGFRLVPSATAPGVTKVPFSSDSARSAQAQGGLAGFLRDATNQALFVSPDPRVRLGSLLTAPQGLSMVLGPLVPGYAVAFSEGNPVASGSAGFVAWTADGAQALPPVGFSAAGDDQTLGLVFYQSLVPARGALAVQTAFGHSLGGSEESAEFGTASTGFAKRAEGQAGLFDRNATTPRWLPSTGLPTNSSNAVADRGFAVRREATGNCLYQFGVTGSWVATGRCLADPGYGVSDVAGDAFALATATEVQVSLPGRPTLRAPSPSLSKIAFDGRRVLGFDRASTVYVFEIQGDRLVKVFERLVPGVRSVALDANSDRGLVGLNGGAALLVAK
jgi:hypothetical protein